MRGALVMSGTLFLFLDNLGLLDPTVYDEGMLGFNVPKLLLLSKATKNLMDTDSGVQRKYPH